MKATIAARVARKVSSIGEYVFLRKAAYWSPFLALLAIVLLAGCSPAAQQRAQAVADTYREGKAQVNETSVSRWCRYPLAEMRRYWPTAAEAMRADCDARTTAGE